MHNRKEDFWAKAVVYSIAGIVLLPSLGFCTFGSYMNEKNQRNQEKSSKSLIQQLYRVAAGEDNLIDSRERLGLVRDLGIAETIDENEILFLQPIPGEDGLIAHLGGGFDNMRKYSPHVDRITKIITKEKATKYLEMHPIAKSPKVY